MCETIIIREDDALRERAENFIRKIYAAEYGAQLETFPSHIFALLNDRDEIVCAAGFRFQDDGFFSERYLDSPIEQALSAVSQRTIARGEIFEVTTFASRMPRATVGFIESIGRFGEANGFVWSFFTLTRRLHRLVERLGHPLTHLADADYRRIPDHERWGTYYDSEPKVFAIARSRLASIAMGCKVRDRFMRKLSDTMSQ
jgi:Thermostable hemolysin